MKSKDCQHNNRWSNKGLKTQFVWCGVPDTVVTDNEPWFSSKEFTTFSKSWGFNHVTSSPHYPKSNSKAENAVKTLKRLLKKCTEAYSSWWNSIHKVSWKCIGTCKGLVAPRNYEEQVGERIYLCNRHQLIEANKPPVADPPVVDLHSSDLSLLATNLPKGTQRQDIEQMAFQQEQKSPPHPSNASAIESQPCRSGRITKPLKWIEGYVPSWVTVSNII